MAAAAAVPAMPTNGVHQTEERKWWKETAVYQIYPSSFKDSNGDGVGDIPGVIEKLDYLKQLGVEVVWVSPIYKSPRVDMGYDVADYRAIDPRYGTFEDVKQLIQGLHSRGMKLLMDLVVNHTSDQHEWFQQSKSSPGNKYRDWYIWRKPKYDEHGFRQPPNNWSSYFGGSAWEYDSSSDEYYLHLFAKGQPDLNWEHPPTREAVHDIIRFWLDNGVDGFRMDVINFISKAPGLPDARVTDPSAKYQHGSEHYACGPRLHEFLHDIGRILKEYNAFSVGEMPYVSDPVEVLRSVGEDRGELNMIFNFDIVDMDHGVHGKFSPRSWPLADLKAIVSKWQTFMYENHGWNALYLENHDQSRTVSRWGSDTPKFRAHTAKMFATFLTFQSGTVFIYQGQELGMRNVPEDWDMSEYRDIETLNHWDELKQNPTTTQEDLKAARKQYQLKSRDNARTPVQWSSEPNGGFSTAKPWMRVNDDFKAWNAAAQVSVPGSVFEYWAQALRLRKEFWDVFVYGDFKLVCGEDEDVFAYSRSSKDRTAVVVCNFRETLATWILPSFLNPNSTRVLQSNYPDLRLGSSRLTLRPFEAFVCMFNATALN